jgi:HlyD family secretion protein
MRRVAPILVVLVVIGGLVVWRLEQKRKETATLVAQRVARSNAPPLVSVAAAEQRDIANTFEATGSLEAPLDVKLSPKVSGRITYLAVHEGDRIHSGQVLVRLDPAEVEADVRQAQAALSEAQYRLAQAQIVENPTTVAVATQVRQQEAAVASAQADFDQAEQNLEAQIAAAEAAVTDVQGRIESASAAIDNAQAAIHSAQANLDNAKTRYDRIHELYEQGFIAAQDVDDAKAAVAVQQAAVDAAQGQLRGATAGRGSAVAQKQAAENEASIVRKKGEADVEAARQRLAQAKAALESAKANTAQTPAYAKSLAALNSSVEVAQAGLEAARVRRQDTILTSPLDGYVTGRFMDPGAMATPGQPILAVQFQGQLWVGVAVPDTVSVKVHLGQPVTVRFDALPGRTFTAGVVQINRSADPQARQFTVRAVLANKDELLRPGMFAHVSIVTDRVRKAVAVAREAVQEDGAGSFVLVVDDASQVHRRAVKTGVSDARFIQVTLGLKAGEQVVVVTSVPLRDGQTVNPGAATTSGRGAGSAAGGQTAAATGGSAGAGPRSRSK